LRRSVVASLKEFLKEQAENLRIQEPERAKKRDEWVAAVSRLCSQIRGWLSQADPDGEILEIKDRHYEIREEGIGTYTVSGISISLGPRHVDVVPVARNVVGPLSTTGVIYVPRAYGRVDLSNGLEKFMLFRVEKQPEDRWTLVGQDRPQMERLDQSTFEAAFQSLLE
jgi:hypothetical protein